MKKNKSFGKDEQRTKLIEIALVHSSLYVTQNKVNTLRCLYKGRRRNGQEISIILWKEGLTELEASTSIFSMASTTKHYVFNQGEIPFFGRPVVLWSVQKLLAGLV